MKIVSLFEIRRFAEDIKHIVWCFGLGYFMLMGVLLNNIPLAFFNMFIFYLLGQVAEQWLIFKVMEVRLGKG